MPSASTIMNGVCGFESSQRVDPGAVSSQRDASASPCSVSTGAELRPIVVGRRAGAHPSVVAKSAPRVATLAAGEDDQGRFI
jgi:hypothetical protein